MRVEEEIEPDPLMPLGHDLNLRRLLLLQLIQLLHTLPLALITQDPLFVLELDLERLRALRKHLSELINKIFLLMTKLQL